MDQPKQPDIESMDAEDDTVMVQEKSNRLCHGAEPVKATWFNFPKPVPPKVLQDADLVIHGLDLPLGVISWSVLGHRVTGLLTLLRGVLYVFRQQAKDESMKAKLVLGNLVGFTSLNVLALRLMRHKKGPFNLFGWFCAIIGPVQFALWCMCNPSSTLGLLFRKSVFVLVQAYIAAIRRFRLEGTPLLQKVSFPVQPKDISKQWVQSKLASCLVGENFSIQSLKSEKVVEKQNKFVETTRLVLSYDSESASNALLPTSLVAKQAIQDVFGVATCRTFGFYLNETLFYREIAPRLYDGWSPTKGVMLQVPQAYCCCFDDRSSEFMLLLQNPFSEENPPGFQRPRASWAKACSVATRLARFHSRFWARTVEELERSSPSVEPLSSFGWLGINSTYVDISVRQAFDQLIDQELLSTNIRPSTQALLRSFVENVEVVISEFKRRPATLLHGDCRMENMVWPEKGPLAQEQYVCSRFTSIDESYDRHGVSWFLVNWQALSKGTGISDLANFVALELNVVAEIGDQFDRALVERYYSTLCASVEESRFDPTQYTLDDCWRDYCISIFLASITPITATQLDLSKPDQRTLREEMLKKCVGAIERVDAGSKLQELFEAKLPLRQMNGQLSNYRLVEEQMLSVEDGEGEHATVILRSPTPKDESLSHILPSAMESLKVNGMSFPGAGPQDAFDRWILTGYDHSGEISFGATLAVYPGRGVVDGSFSIVLDGVQHNARASRKLSSGEWNGSDKFTAFSEVGPISITVIEPLEKFELHVFVPGYIVADIEFTARYAPVMESPYEASFKTGGGYHYDRMTQAVTCRGSLSVFDRTIKIEDSYGSRVRMWGCQPHSTADHSAWTNKLRNYILSSKYLRNHVMNPLFHAHSPQNYWFWAMIHFQYGSIAYHSLQSKEGKVLNGAALIFGDPFGIVVGASRPTKPTVSHAPYGRCEAAGHSVCYFPGTRHAKSCTIVLALHDGRRITLSCQSRGTPFYMSGLGFAHPTWGHATDHITGESGCHLRVQFDTFRSNARDRNHPESWHVQESILVTAQLAAAQSSPDDDPIATSVAVGTAEQIIVGPHLPSNFHTLYDV